MTLEEQLKENWSVADQSLPWPLGLNEDKASPRTLAIAQILSTEELLAISKFNPFREDRDKAIRKLNRRRLPKMVLAELCGYSRDAVTRIVKKKN